RSARLGSREAACARTRRHAKGRSRRRGSRGRRPHAAGRPSWSGSGSGPTPTARRSGHWGSVVFSWPRLYTTPPSQVQSALQTGSHRPRIHTMRIAQVAPLFASVPPRRYGGTERVVSWLTEELVRKGHEVTLFASGDSVTKARLVPVCPRALWQDPTCRDTLPHHVRLVELVARE